jgi:hypothetical protein
MIITATSCRHGFDDPFGEWAELTGDTDIVTDTITIVDTVFVDNVIVQDSVIYIYVNDTVYDTIDNSVIDTVTIETVFDCYGIGNNGNIIATDVNGNDYMFSYNVRIETTGDKMFSVESDEPFVLDKKSSSFDNNFAYFTVSKGTEQVSLPVYVRGANSVVINNEEIEPCYPFSVTANLQKKADTEIAGKWFETSEVLFQFRNGANVVIATATQRVYAPKAEPENQRTVTIEHQAQDGVLIVRGVIDNTLYGDTVAEVTIPLSVSMECQERVVVEGNSFNFSVNGGCYQVNSQVVNTFQSENNGMVVNYEAVEETFHQNYSACGNAVTVNQTVNCYNNFRVEFGGETKEIKLPVSITNGNAQMASVEVSGNEAHRMVTVPYNANQSGATASASQEVDMVIKAITFDGQRVVEAYRTISTNSHEAWLVYDCVLATDGSRNFYHYREIVNGVPGAWVSEELTDENYEFITDKSSYAGHGKYGLAIYYHKNHGGPFVGVVTDDINGAKEVVYHAHGKQRKTVTASRFAVFGKLNTAIAGSSVEDNGLMKMTCQEVTLNETQVISPAGEVYFY